MFGLGPPELLIVLVIILLLFGARKVPELAKGLGTGVREFRKGTSGDYDEVEEEKKKDEEIASGGDSVDDRLERDASAKADHEEQKQS